MNKTSPRLWLGPVGRALWTALQRRDEQRSLVWLRVPGDMLFAGGAVTLALFMFGLLRRPASEKSTATQPNEA